MSEEDTPIRLHDRATRGLPLSEAERARLDNWYAEQDAAESAVLLANKPSAINALQEQINTSLTQLQTLTIKIQTLTSENEALKQEIAGLYRQLAQAKQAQPV
jgi:predicted RNase H-like nuclease (RuvC/YqgF family)